jgi:hypothetical protein
MLEVFVFRVGPFELPSGPLSLYFAFGSDLEPIPATDDEAALREIADHERDRLLTCEPKLRQAGEKLGFAVRPFSRRMAHRCAIASLALTVAPSLEDASDSDVTDALCDSAHVFAFAEVTRVLPAGASYLVDTRGVVARRYESMLQGADSGVHGFVLYEEMGTVSKLHSGPEPQVIADSLGLFLLKEPEFAVEALRRVYGLDWLPRPTSVKNGARTNLTQEQVLTISAAARAFGDMATRRTETGRSTVEIDDMIVEVEVRPFEPMESAMESLTVLSS